MNKHLHRIIFNAARGMRMVVQETASSTGKGASKATSNTAGKNVAAVAFFGVLVAMPGQAQIVGAPNVPGHLRPTVLVAPNGVPLVNIQTPSAAGVSRNVYNRFDVMRNGAILNNSRLNVQTQLGGIVQGNPWLASGPARVILNEINGGNPTQLRGYVEVGGQRAEVIVANPAGISVDGGGFINASRATLTTGTPQLNAMGGLDSFLVRGGTVSIDGAGLDLSKTDYAAILARAVQVSAGIWASELKVVAGANQVSADHGTATPVAGSGPAPTFALDVAALGGMYAQKITLIGTEAGLGVRNAGNIGAGAGGLVVTAQGRLENIGTLEGQRVALSSTSDIDNRGGTIRQTGMSGLTIDSPVLTNTKDGVIGAEPAPQANGTGGTANGGSAPSGPGTSNASASVGSGMGDGASPGQPYVPPAPGLITAAGTIRNDGGRIYAGGPITLKTPQIDNAGGTLNVATMAVTGANFSNAGGTLNVSQSFGANVGRFDNTGGKLNAGSLNIVASGDLINVDGTLTSDSDASLTVGGKVDNTRGTLSATGRLTADVAGAVNNTAGTLVAGTDVSVKAGALNTSGSIRGGNDTTLAVVGALVNEGSITAGRNTTITAQSVTAGTASQFGAGVQSDGQLGGAGDLQVTTSGALIANGNNTAAGNATLQGAGVDLSGSQTRAADIAVTATEGDVTTRKATVAASAMLRLTVAGALDNSDKGAIGAGGNITVAAGSLDNTQGTVVAEKGDLRLTTSGTTTNSQGVMQAGGAATLVNGGLVNAGGKVTGNSVFINAGDRALNNDHGTLTSSTTLEIQSGAVDNKAGVIRSGGAMTIDTHGANYDNRGGQTEAAGNLSLKAGGGAIDNRGALIRSMGTTALAANAVNNADTQGDGLGIEGENVAIASGGLNNTAGAMRSGIDTTIASSGQVDNGSGLISAGKRLKIDAANLVGNGKTTSGKDVSIALTQDAVNNVDVMVDGSLSYTTTGSFTNNGKLLAGQTLTVGGSDVANTANAEMAGTNTTVNASGTLTNRGLIDSKGTTQIDAGMLNNIGTGRIYGDAVSIAVGTLNNDAETLNGATKAATIAARDTLNIGATTINNREHSLLFSAGGLLIGGALDANRLAVGQGGTLKNLSASIESLDEMSVSMGQIYNWDTHVRLGPQKTTVTGPVVTVAPMGGSKMYTMDEVVVGAGKPYVWARNPDGTQGALLYSNGFGIWQSMLTKTADTAIDADPARIVAGGSMTLDAQVSNKDSRIVGRTVHARSIRNEALKGTSKTDIFATVIDEEGKPQGNVSRPGTPETMDVGSFEYRATANGTTGYAIGSASTGSVSPSGPGVIVQVPANGNTGGNANGGSGAAGVGATRTIPMVVRTSMPNAAIPQTSLFGIHAGPGGYLIETDPRFANYRNWLSSDYLLNNLGLDPNYTLKRLGDGFYEQRLIREQVAQLTGYRYLDGQHNDEEQYTALMNWGATFAREYGLRPGIALTSAQMAQLTSDIVWLVEQAVTLPDGSTQQVLVPQVYVRVRPGDIDGSGALLSADSTFIEGAGDLVNTGTIAGRTLVKIDKDNVDNLGGRIAGGNVDIHARNDINNIGGSVTAADSAVLKAGRDINIETTTRTQSGVFASGTDVDRVAGVYVSNPGGTLTARAGNNVNLIGAVLSNSGEDSFTSITADKSINLGTVTEQSQLTVVGATSMHRSASSKEVGSTIVGNGTVLLDAKGGDINLRAATIDAGTGVLGLTAKGDVNILAGEETQSMVGHSQTKKKRALKSITTTTDSETQSTTGIGSRLSGASVGVFAGGDINVLGSDIEARKNAVLKADGSVNIVSSVDSASASLDSTRTTKGFIAPKLGGPSIDRKLSLAQHANVSSQTQRASNVTAGENLTITADEQVNVFASNLSSGKDLKVKGAQVTILSGTNEVSREIGTKTSKQSIGTMGNFKRAGKGMNGKSSVTDSVNQTTLAPATLSGKNVTLEATDGNLTLGAVQIQADEQVALGAPKGRVNMAVVQTTTQVSQSRGESDPMYQRTRDTGSHAETANYTRIDSKTLKLDTPKLNVEVGQNAVKGQNGATAAQQTIAHVLQAQRNQPGMGWLQRVQSDPALSSLQIDWQGVPLERRQWAESQGSLPEAGSAVLAIVVAVLR